MNKTVLFIVQWEYFSLSIPNTTVDRETELLNKYGQERWQLVSVVPFGAEVVFYFMRPLQPQVGGSAAR